MSKLSIEKAKEHLSAGAEKVCYLDVRNFDEYKAGHVPGAVCIPLAQLEKDLALIPKDKLLIVGCAGGSRAGKATELLRSKGFSNVMELEGGFSAWLRSGAPVHRAGKAKLPVMQQVQVVAGGLCVIGAACAYLWDPLFLLIPGFVGSGLMFAGFTGWCGMASILEKMPWNKN